MTKLVESPGLPSDSASLLEAEAGKLDIKRCQPEVTFYQFTSCFTRQTCDYDVVIDFRCGLNIMKGSFKT